MHHCPKIPFLLVGSKSDLRKNVSGKLMTDGNQLAEEIKAKKYVECSSKTRYGVENVIDEAISAVLKNTPQKTFCVLI